ncbi:MAG: amidase [Bryobacterales bacterium]|nr:amidase [Bryobacterales bacterium]
MFATIRGVPPNTWTLHEMAARVRGRDLSPRELVEAHLDRIERINPEINAFTVIMGEQAMAQARACETYLTEGPLHGVPVTVKDSFDVRGMPTLSGSKFRLGHIADRDSNAVARLREAGAIVLGKTNVPELLSSYETDNFVTGRTVNPWNAARTAGGSSGGEAAAIAARCSPGGVGSDGGGSIRIPAHFCGLAGVKPTHRRGGGGGQFPLSPPPSGLMSAPGPMARTVADVRLLFEVLQGVDDRDSLSVAGSAAGSVRPRIGVMRQFYQTPVDSAISAAVERAARTLEGCGYEVEEFSLKGLERAPNVWAFFFGELGSHHTRDFLAGRESEAHWTITENLRDTPPADARKVVEQFDERERLRALALEQMQRYPLLLMPPASIPAFPHRERRFAIAEHSIGLFAAMALSTVWNLLGFPALVLPFGKTAGGLPVGIQLVGRPFEDETVLRVGEQLEEERCSA